MKIIYVFEKRLPYEGDDIKFGYNIFLENGYEIEVWSLAHWLYGWDGDSESLSGGAKLDNQSYVRTIRNKEEFLKNITRITNQECFFLCYPYHGYNGISFFVRKILFKNNLPFANITLSPYLTGIGNKPVSMTFIRAVFLVFRNFIVRNIYYFCKWIVSFGRKKKLLQNIKDSGYSFIGYLLYPSVYNFVTTRWMYYSYPNPLERWSNRNILICTNSYDEYLQSKAAERVMPERYIVFVDQGLLSLDNRFIAQGLEIPIKEKKKYCKDLMRLFEKLEYEYKCPVVIALHPKAAYMGNEFGNRKMFSNKTPQLIRDAELVINQYSTVFGLAMMYKKDILEIYTTELFENYGGDYRKGYVDYEDMGYKLLNIAEADQVERVKEYIFPYDENVYSKYIDVLIKSDGSIAEDKTFYQYIYDYIYKWRKDK